jgi:hypothetical protein
MYRLPQVTRSFEGSVGIFYEIVSTEFITKGESYKHAVSNVQ